MKVIFLDVDGVLNSTRKSEVILTVLTRRIRRKLLPDFPVYNIFGVRTHLVRKLKKIVDKTNAVVVLSSTWRGDFFSPKEERGRNTKQLRNKLQRFTIPVIGRTCSDFAVCGRGCQIQDWIDRHNDDYTLSPIEGFVILDDESFDIEEHQDLKPHFIKTSMTKGLTNKQTKQAIKILNSELPIDI